MRNTRKWLVLLLTIVMLVSNLSVGAMAAQDESPIALQLIPAAEPDSALQVQILATQGQTVADGKLVVTYDAEKLTYTGAETGTAWADREQVTLSVNPADGKIILAFASADAASAGVLFTLSLTANETADSVITLDGSSYITGVDAELTQQISTCPSARFVDLSRLSEESHTAVDHLVRSGYMNGMSQTTFGPYLELNRAMMVTILYRIAGEPAVEGTPVFTDVRLNDYYTDAVVWATNAKITNGISESLFAPEKPLTRQELAAFLYRFAGVMGYDRTAAAELSDYSDADLIQPYALESFQWAVGAGVIKGTTDTTLSPEDTTTREQVCLMVYRLLSAQD